MKKTNFKLELLSPARDVEIGKAAILHGADAVYIGADRFGARATAGNSMHSIEELCAFAHSFGARVYLTLNTLLFDSELEEAQNLVQDAWNAGVDAVIFQDFALLAMDLPPIALHASTQAHNMDADHIRFLEASGVSRVVLARELNLSQITEIRKKTSIELEAFVHGALCVSHSGRCRMSLVFGGRSANRGVCAQPCRLPWNLEDADGKILKQEKYLLSLKDMDRSNFLEELILAGITSFKIEGRLKDMAYVKNITAFYRKKLDGILERSAGGRPASDGKVSFFFTPSPEKTFHRGETSFDLSGKREEIWNFDTPKARGEKIGRIRGMEGEALILETGRDVKLHAGDGLCFVDEDGVLQGFPVNGVDGKKVFPEKKKAIFFKGKKLSGRSIWRNHDIFFKKALDSEKSAVRKLPVEMIFREEERNFSLELHDLSAKLSVKVFGDFPKISAENEEKTLAFIKKQLEKTGDSIFFVERIRIESTPCVFKASDLNSLRREALSELYSLRLLRYERPLRKKESADFSSLMYPVKNIDASFNVASRLARGFYEKHGCRVLEMASESTGILDDGPVMTTRHCLRYALGRCPRFQGARPEDVHWKLSGHGRVFMLFFDCASCRMEIVPEGSSEQVFSRKPKEKARRGKREC